MKAVYALLVAVFVVVATVPGAASASDVETREQIEDDGRSELGDNVTSFVHSTTAETRGVVANEKWEAGFERNGDKRAVERRIDRLEVELVDLRERRDALDAAAENDTLSESQYYGRLGELDGELSALTVSIDATEAAAERVDANASRLSSLRSETRETHADLAGPGQHAGPPEELPGRANGSDNADDSSEGRELTDPTAAETSGDPVPEAPGEDPATLGDAVGDDDAESDDDEPGDGVDEPGDGLEGESPDDERPPDVSTTRVDGEALGKEDVRSAESDT
ncbi:hypothetical protein [Haloprofundus halobius]|uniref:hypothetical protein n=1 Tax=Haloprofundus halobius TaxID=2876194 RepID=UPI001CCBA9C2|nr:hypothetical protein [Haloprofundus halobius]